jgi:hypothetical protein
MYVVLCLAHLAPLSFMAFPVLTLLSQGQIRSWLVFNTSSSVFKGESTLEECLARPT